MGSEWPVVSQRILDADKVMPRIETTKQSVAFPLTVSEDGVSAKNP
jgi:hypothetical protein